MVKNLSFKQRLKQIGLSDNEATVYLAVLEKGRITPTEVATETSLNHVTSYRVLKYLVEKGLISENREGKKKLYFSVEDPDRIQKYLRTKKQEIDEQEKYLEDLMPNLKTIFQGHKRSKIDFFEGKEGVVWSQKELACHEDSENVIYEIVPIDYALKNFPKAKNDPRDKFKKFTSITIYTSENGDFFRVLGSKTKYVPPADLNILTELVVLGNLTVINTLEGKYGGIMIRDKNVAQLFKAVIRLLYKTLPNRLDNAK